MQCLTIEIWSQSHFCCNFKHHNYEFLARKLWWIQCFGAYFGMISVLCACQRGQSSSPDRYILVNLSITALCQQYRTGTICFCNSLQTKDTELWRIWKVQTSVEPWHICCGGHLLKTCRCWAVFDWAAGPSKCLYQHGSLLGLCLKVLSGCPVPSDCLGGRSDNSFSQVYYLFSTYRFSRKNHRFRPLGSPWPPQMPQKLRRSSQHIPATLETFT